MRIILYLNTFLEKLQKHQEKCGMFGLIGYKIYLIVQGKSNICSQVCKHFSWVYEHYITQFLKLEIRSFSYHNMNIYFYICTICEYLRSCHLRDQDLMASLFSLKSFIFLASSSKFVLVFHL